MTDWYTHIPGQGRAGPYTADDLRAAYRGGTIPPGTLVWRAGSGQWQPLDRYAHELQLDSSSTQPPALPMAPTQPGPSGAAITTLPHTHNTVPPVETPGHHLPYAPPRAVLSEANSPVDIGAEVVYAGFWRRLAALMIDSLVVSIAYYVVLVAAVLVLGLGTGMLTGNGQAPSTGMMALLGAAYLLYPLASGLYYVGFESSSAQATLGKMAVGIKVGDNDGRRLSRRHALGRWCSHLLCYLTFYVGYLMAAFTQRKRGLHDMAAGTLVVDRWAYTASASRQQQGLGTITVVVLVLGLLAIVCYIGLLLAIALPAYQDYLRQAAG